MTKLYDRTFSVDAMDRERDTAVAARLQVRDLLYTLCSTV